MGRIFLCSVAVIYLLTVLGCAARTSTMTTANLTYPVNIGPVKHIKGKPSPALTCNSQSVFAIEAENWLTVAGSTEAGGWRFKGQTQYRREGQNKFDVGLMSYSIDGKGMLLNINTIVYGSYQGGFVVGYWDKSWVGINGNACKR